MPIIKVDVKGLEWRTAVFLSQDQVALNEILNNFDLHQDNQLKLNLPTRLLAKTFLFRLIFGGSAYSYANDYEFNWISNDIEYWDNLIDKFLNKYKGLKTYREKIIETGIKTGKIIMPHGRIYTFSPTMKSWGQKVWPEREMLNYPVQGLGADLVSIARSNIYYKLNKLNIEALLINTIHDDIQVDSATKHIDTVAKIMKESIENTPKYFQQLFNIEFNVPLSCEIFVGQNKRNMVEYNLN